MQIQLKQSEIVSALKQYIAGQGINLYGKNVDITFTASRSAAGIVADISIEEIQNEQLLFANTAVMAKSVSVHKTADAEVPMEPEPVYEVAEPTEAPKTASLFS